MTSRHWIWLRWGGALLLLLALLGVARAAEPAAAPIKVFVSIQPQKYFVERVGGQHVTASVMVGPGQSPVTYEPTPSQLSRLAGARIYFRIGVEFEKVWMTRIAAANPGMRVIDMRSGIAPRPVERPAGTTAPTVHQGLADPHVWTSPPLVRVMAANIRDALSKLDPAHRAVFGANYEVFAADLDRLDHDIRVLLKNVSTRNFMVFHPAWGYFADTYGLTQIPIEVGGKEPGARTLAQVIDIGRKERVKVIFVQAQFSRRTAETVAQAIGARVVVVDPLAEDYINNLRRVAREFAEAMQ
jgi:zinc transport system substrate-binding protein